MPRFQRGGRGDTGYKNESEESSTAHCHAPLLTSIFSYASQQNWQSKGSLDAGPRPWGSAQLQEASRNPAGTRGVRPPGAGGGGCI